MQHAEIYAVPSATAETFEWRWRTRSRHRSSSCAFVFYYDCLEDARRNGYAARFVQPRASTPQSTPAKRVER